MTRRIGALVLAAALLAGCGEAPSREAAGIEPAGGADGASNVVDPAGAQPGDPADPDEPVSNDPEQPVSDQSAGGASSAGGGAGQSAGSTGGGSQPNPGIAPGEPHPGASSCPECTSRPAPDEDDLTQPRPGQANVRARRWESASVHADDVTIDIRYWSGVEPCYVLDRVEVREEAARVVITLYEGSQPNFDGACTEQAVERTTRIRLSSPLRSRALVDGSGSA
jgi:hypothetical protein